MKLIKIHLEGMLEHMPNNNVNQNVEIDNIEADFDFEEAEDFLSKQLEENFSSLELLKRDRENISNPDFLGKIIANEVWKQFGNQIGLDMTNETLVEKYDREHPEQYKDIADSVMKDQQYKDFNKTMKKKQQAGNLKDEYTGRALKPEEKANLDHVIPRKEIFENPRRKQANLDVASLANKEENLKPTNESLNKSKGSKSNKEYIASRETREKSLIKQNEKANKKVNESTESDSEKRWQKQKNNKHLNDKLAANDSLMMQADKVARKEINKEILFNATIEVGKKAGIDALKTMVISALFTLLKEIMNGFIRFLKEKSKSFNGFLTKMKESIRSFLSKILSIVQTGTSTLIGTILSEIFGPIVGVFKKLSSLIKQGISSVIDAINYLQDKRNKNQPFSIKVVQVGKIITVGLVGSSAIFLGDVFEKGLLTIPGMQIKVPQIGTLANVVGLFLSSLVSGLIGAIVLNILDKFIARKLKEESDIKIIDKNNKIMNLQKEQLCIAENHVTKLKENFASEISRNHALMGDIMQQSLNKIFDEGKHTYSQNTDNISDNQRDLAEMQNDLEHFS